MRLINKSYILKILVCASLLVSGVIFTADVSIAQETKKKTTAKVKPAAEKKAVEDKKAGDSLEKSVKAKYDKQMIAAVKLFSQKKDDLAAKTRAEVEDVLTLAADQAQKGFYGDALIVLEEIEGILSGSKKESDAIVIQNEETGNIKSYQFDVNKENQVVSSTREENAAGEEIKTKKAAVSEETTATTAPDGKFKIERLSAAEQKLYKDLLYVLPKAEDEAKMHQSPENARRLVRMRRAFYNIKKKGMGFQVDESVISELTK
ncbi:MAG TPA: hypothetical protein PKK26_08910 [Candidatus Wallbacteria bacterium]|nr:hypothetical protein [Candidatus Wallbacteria bacterium]